ncbi:type II secretion system protein J [Vampirovibrio sp.]|uniref:PulJ/GspJ family protein n=1 Tax=Vampirovibrio sp. TaxID=2717857 RepID=UPI0035930460
MTYLKAQFKQPALPGLTLVEILVGMALMGFVLLSISNFVVKSNVQSNSLSMRFKEASEVHSVLQDIRDDLHRGAYISPNSFNRRLEYTTHDLNTGNALKKVYGLCYYSAVQTTGTDTTCPLFGGANTIPYLKLSLDGGASWESPYRVSGFNKYRLSGTPKFLYAHASNDCWDFTDTNANGVLGSGDAAPASVSCSANSWFGVATSARVPQTASKVVLANFSFTTGTGSPEAIRALPTYIFIAAAPGLVRSTLPAVAPGVKDSQLVQSFSTDPAVNVAFPTGYNPRGLSWDKAHQVLLLTSSEHSQIFRTERNGVFVDIPFTINDNTIKPYWLAVEGNGDTVSCFTLGSHYYRFNLNNGPLLTPLIKVAPGSIGHYRGWAYNSNYPDYIYNLNHTPSFRIEQRSKLTAAVTGAVLNTDYWSMPAAFSDGLYMSGLFIEPVSGNFYVLLNSVYTSGGRNYVDVYKIARATGATTLDFSIDLTDLGSSATGTVGQFQMDYDPVLNRIFLLDNPSQRVYEISPPKLIAPRT